MKINYDKWRRAMNGKSIGGYEITLQDPFGNKHFYYIKIMYMKEDEQDQIYIQESLYNEEKIPEDLNILHNKPANFFLGKTERMGWYEKSEFDFIIDCLFDPETRYAIIDDIYEDFMCCAVKEDMTAWMNTGIYKILSINHIFLFRPNRLKTNTNN